MSLPPRREAPSVPSFDAQARTFDRHAAIPLRARERIAAAILAVAGNRHGVRIVDIGAGTGTIGYELARLPVEYVGFDRSRAMLAVFRERFAGADAPPSLLVADATKAWPLPDRSVDVVFGSRSWHWIPPQHAVSEVLRVGVPGVCLLIGRIARDPSSIRARLRAELVRLLENTGVKPRRGDRHARALLTECSRVGATLLEQRSVADWKVALRPREALDAWRSKQGLAGLMLGADEKEAILRQLEAWSLRELGPADVPREQVERYVLSGARLGESHA